MVRNPPIGVLGLFHLQCRLFGFTLCGSFIRCGRGLLCGLPGSFRSLLRINQRLLDRLVSRIGAVFVVVERIGVHDRRKCVDHIRRITGRRDAVRILRGRLPALMVGEAGGHPRGGIQRIGGGRGFPIPQAAGNNNCPHICIPGFWPVLIGAG